MNGCGWTILRVLMFNALFFGVNWFFVSYLGLLAGLEQYTNIWGYTMAIVWLIGNIVMVIGDGGWSDRYMDSL